MLFPDAGSSAGGESDALGEGLLRVLAGLLGETEVEDFGVAAAGDEDVGGLDVPVDDVLGVSGVERVCDLDAEVEKEFEVESFAFDEVLQGAAVEKLHDDEGLTALLADVVNRADVGVIEGGCGFGLAAEASEGLRVAGQAFGKEFQGDGTMKAGVFGLIDDTHATAAELIQDAVMGERLSDKGERVRHRGGMLGGMPEHVNRVRRELRVRLRCGRGIELYAETECRIVPGWDPT